MLPIIRRRFLHFFFSVRATARMFLAPTEFDSGDVCWGDEPLNEAHTRQIRSAGEPNVAVRYIRQCKGTAILFPKDIAANGERQGSERSALGVERPRAIGTVAGLDEFIDLSCQCLALCVAVQPDRHDAIWDEVMDKIPG